MYGGLRKRKIERVQKKGLLIISLILLVILVMDLVACSLI